MFFLTKKVKKLKKLKKLKISQNNMWYVRARS